jgi:antitoxin ParD1/3/4
MSVARRRCAEPAAERSASPEGALRGRSGSVLEAPAFVAGLDDLAVVGQAIEKRGGHLGVAEHARPFPEGEVGGDDDRGALEEAQEQLGIQDFRQDALALCHFGGAQAEDRVGALNLGRVDGQNRQFRTLSKFVIVAAADSKRGNAVNVSLTPKLESFVKAKVKSGLYNNASEVLREALRLLQARDRAEREQLRHLRTALIAGERSGPTQPFDLGAFIAELDAGSRKRA